MSRATSGKKNTKPYTTSVLSKKKKEWVAGITMKTKSTKSTNKNHKNNLGIRAEDFSPTDLGPCVRRCVCPRQQKWYRWTRHFSEACTVGTGISQVSHKIFINPVTQSTDGEICYDLLSARNRGGFVNGFAWITGSVYQCILHIYIHIYIYSIIYYVIIYLSVLLCSVAQFCTGIRMWPAALSSWTSLRKRNCRTISGRACPCSRWGCVPQHRLGRSPVGIGHSHCGTHSTWAYLCSSLLVASVWQMSL